MTTDKDSIGRWARVDAAKVVADAAMKRLEAARLADSETWSFAALAASEAVTAYTSAVRAAEVDIP